MDLDSTGPTIDIWVLGIGFYGSPIRLADRLGGWELALLVTAHKIRTHFKSHGAWFVTRRERVETAIVILLYLEDDMESLPRPLSFIFRL